MIEVRCPHCKEVLRVVEQEIGTTGHCSRCQGHICILTPTEPVPQSEAPMAHLAREHDPHAKQKSRPITVGHDSAHPDRELLVKILIDLDQMLHLLRYIRNEIPEDEEFEPERQERRAWVEKMGNFGGAILEGNAKSRLDDVNELMQQLTNGGYEKLYLKLQKGFEAPGSLKSPDLVDAIEVTKSYLEAMDQGTPSAVSETN